MDLSKLPKLSETPPPPAPPVESASNQEELSDHRRVDPSEMIGAEVWLSAIIGLIFLLLGRRFAIYLFSVVSGKAFHTGVNWISGAKAGQEVGYRELEGFVFFNESAMFAFGLALIFEAIVLAVLNLNIPGKRPLIFVALLIAGLATVYNLIVALMLFTTGALPLFSLLAVAFGGYIVVLEWRMLQTQPRATHPRRA